MNFKDDYYFRFPISEGEELEKGVSDWKLLLQIDSEEEIGMMWGDAGRIYFWIREITWSSRSDTCMD
ncbi:YwqG family protein [Paenibacillus radicis (ex Xue et al. 2023)]|uniref:YwqG family protein n=1 Tax=Paenibacillus radicis (ex Xue et al. 2023) TaxID=2972489 RepID=A0ABT1YG77_9BACL|nr:YwqG family protein [Paenibacillus radicis (ex Xue et al. 2023)]MCR8632194.1 YwqG family protein [Paenibacillus radicis (ex Xue et al. 2023)]